MGVCQLKSFWRRSAHFRKTTQAILHFVPLTPARTPKAGIYCYSPSTLFSLRLLCWFFTTRRRIQTCGHTISALTQPKKWSPGWRLWRMQHWSTLSQSEGQKTCFSSLWTNQKENIQIPCTTSMTFTVVHFSVCFPRLGVRSAKKQNKISNNNLIILF